MPNNDLPNDPISSAEDEPKLDRLTAIAQARAIRREAAAMDEEIKAQAAETANTILEQAEPVPPKAPLHQQTEPVPVSNTTGKFGWLADLKKPDADDFDSEELVAQVLAETEARAPAESDAAPDAVVAKIVAETAEPDSPEAIVAQVLAETAEASESGAEEPEQPKASRTAADVPAAVRRISPKKPAMTRREAAEQYRKLTAEAKPQVKKLAKQADRAWQREAGSIRAQHTENRTARTAAKWNIAVCLVLMFGIALGMVVFERPTVSMKENRTLAEMPAWSVEGYLNGTFTNGVAEYYNDTVPFRDDFKEIAQVIRKYMGLSGSAVIHGNMQAIPSETAPAETTAAPAETTAASAVAAQTETQAALTTAVAETTAAPAEEEPEREGEISNNILIVDKRGIMLFGGWETMGQNYARILNRYKETMPDVDMYSMVVPTVCSYYTPEEFQYLITSEKANIDYINSCLVDVTPVDAYGALSKHTEEPVFMRTDHHWSGLGAFYAAEQFSADARVPFARIEEYDKQSKDDYVGTLYGYSNDIILKENPEEFFWYVPKAPYRTTYYSRSFTNGYEASLFMNMENVAPVSYYMVYMQGDDHIVRVETEVQNGRKLCVIKDSYGNALIPWLTSSFEEIYVVDMRFFELNFVQFARQQGITDILFAMNSFSANGDNAQKMETILTQ